MFKILFNKKKILNKINTAIKISSNPKNKIKNKIFLILKHEKKYNLYNLKTDFFAWDYLRLHLNTIIESYENQERQYRIFFDKIFQIFKYKNLSFLPFFLPSEKQDYVFFGHPRGELKSNNLIIDEYLDHLISNFPNSKKKIVFGYPHIKYGTKYNYINKRFYIHWIYLIIKILTYFEFFLTNVNSFYPYKLKKIGHNILLKVNIEKWWLNYFKKSTPKIVFIVDIANNLPILRAANRLGILSCEIQHGSPDINKLTYNFYTKKRLSIPTHFISWGRYWKRKMKNYYKKDFYIMGKNISKKIPLCKKKNKNILIIDQRIGRNSLIRKAIQLKESNNNLNVCYRFHPSISLISKEINSLKKNKIKISNPFINTLKNDLKNVRYIIAHSSTAIYELVNNNYEVFVINSNKNQDGLMSDMKMFYSDEKKFGLKKLDNKKIKKFKFFEKLNYNFINKIL